MDMVIRRSQMIVIELSGYGMEGKEGNMIKLDDQRYMILDGI